MRVVLAREAVRAARRAGASLAVAATLLGGCADEGGTPATTAVGQFVRGTTQEPTTIDPELLEPTVACPPISIQPGTEALRREAAGGGEDALRWQASITRTARECVREGEGEGAILIVRVGISGRVIEGAGGAPEVVELPLRVAVREGGEVTYSRIHNVNVSMEGTSQPWAFVDEDVRVGAANARILVGFDG